MRYFARKPVTVLLNINSEKIINTLELKRNRRNKFTSNFEFNLASEYLKILSIVLTRPIWSNGKIWVQQ